MSKRRIINETNDAGNQLWLRKANLALDLD